MILLVLAASCAREGTGWAVTGKGGSGGDYRGGPDAQQGDVSCVDCFGEVGAVDSSSWDLAGDLTDMAGDSDLIEIGGDGASDVSVDLVWPDSGEIQDYVGETTPDDVADGEGQVADVEDALDADEGDVADLELLPVEAPQLDQWGGLAAMPVGTPSGFFSVAQHEGRMWLVDPDGNAFFSLALQSVTYGSLAAPDLGYAPATLSQKARWADVTGAPGDISTLVNNEHIDTMLEYGYNSVGGWSNGVISYAKGKLPYTISLGFAAGVAGGGVSTPVPAASPGGFPDVFHPDFATACAEYAQKQIAYSTAADPWCIGYYVDNELKWWGGNQYLPTTLYTLTDDFADEGPDSPGKQAFVAMMEARYAGDIGMLNAQYGSDFSGFGDLLAAPGLPYDHTNVAHVADRDAFLELIAENYFAGVSAGLKARAPDQLNLCSRFASIAPPAVIKAAAKYCDVVSINDYYLRSDPVSNFALGGKPEERWGKHAQLIWEGAGGPKPVILTEWGIRAKDAGLANSYGAGYVVAAQHDRAQFYHEVLNWLLEREHDGVGFIVGAHWFMYLDEPPTGRFDGEDCNYGISTIRDEHYLFTLRSMLTSNVALLYELLTKEHPSVLPMVSEVKVTLDEASGAAVVTWKKVAGAQGYRIWALTHPAGQENRIAGSWTVGPISQTVVPLQGWGEQWLWFGVEPLHNEVAGMAIRVASTPILTLPAPVEVLSDDEVLGCETLDILTLGNKEIGEGPGPAYARLEESFVPGGGKAIVLEFIPLSRSYVKGLADNSEIVVEMALPVGTVTDRISFWMKPFHSYGPSDVYRSSSEFVQVAAVNAQGQELARWPLAGAGEGPLLPGPVVLELDEAKPVASLRFIVDVLSFGLPLEQAVVLALDEFDPAPSVTSSAPQ